MKQFGLMLAIVMILTACGPAPTPAPTLDVQSTINSFSATMVASTLTAQPSATSLPTNTSSPSPTFTAFPTETATPDLSLPTASATPDLSATLDATPTAWSGTFVPGDINGLPTGFLRIENLTGQKEITITLEGVTLTREQPVYYSYKVNAALVITVLWARYKYIIQIPNKKIFTGTFTQGNKDKTTIRVYLTKDPVIVGP